ncbi:isoprenylcysteine carboxylmethyltransferase family protein [Streptomyces sp. 7-21]|jgi:protein-S-isoprenylcysteine O-methyltransferase Ste14|uniref:methyltransferase family protein n=1 Tax=Streptomyces sp. 7-21 TaxID=2802283 RepID=UPI00191E9098|nr:isoprenylcysteine carboxylmethyltransferase family protein [Streptomyces sp. 7-21]MBL1065960.1 isoprenylcysteine carboxylmethyltransferase family protein [Streptomyces sp. 7-21]
MRTRTAAVISAAWFLVPVIVTYGIPYLLTRWETSVDWDNGWLLAPRVLAGVVIAGAAAFIIDAFVRFVREGRGTPAPAAAPEHLVVTGPYRWVRNPMYCCVVSGILAQALLLWRWPPLVYGLLVWSVFASVVRFREEPFLRETHGEEFERYRAAVRAWIPRLRPWHG